MLREASHLIGQPIDASDGRLGTIEDLYFDDESWRVRYVLVRAGLPLRREHLLIEPGSIVKPGWPDARLGVWMSRREARGGIAVEEVDPPARRIETSERASGGPRLHAELLDDVRQAVPAAAHLQSVRAAVRYRLSARDGAAGRVRDFVVDDVMWAMAHLCVDVDLFIGRKTVLVPPRFVEGVDATGCAVRVGLTRHALGGAPRFQSLALMSRLYEMCVHDYYTSATGTPLMRPARRRVRPAASGKVDGAMLLSTLLD
jgi:hypothetical protein